MLGAFFKSYPPGYRGRGRLGELLGFYCEDLCTGFCDVVIDATKS